LLGPGVAVRIGPADLAPADGVTPALLRVLVDDSVPAGVQALSVVHRSGAGSGGQPPSRVVARSAAVPVLVRPWLSAGAVVAGKAHFAMSPPLFPGQRATLTLSGLGEPPDRGPVVFALDPVPPARAVRRGRGRCGRAGERGLAGPDRGGRRAEPARLDGVYTAPAVSVP
jgi:hypothetical protein